MQQNTKQNGKRTVVHTTNDNEDTAKRAEPEEQNRAAEQNETEQSLVYLALPLMYSALRNIATANRPIAEQMKDADRRPATQGEITFTATPGKISKNLCRNLFLTSNTSRICKSE